jgi:cytoskeletal protein CcmA (bactofilin family)
VLRTVVERGGLACTPHGVAAGRRARHQEAVFHATLAAADTLVVPRGARIVGNLEAGNVHVQGVVYGQVRATHGCLVVDLDASVHGTVIGAGTVVIAGGVRATGLGPAVVAHGKLCLAQSARVRGTVRYAVIEIYEGARLVGPLLALAQA